MVIMDACVAQTYAAASMRDVHGSGRPWLSGAAPIVVACVGALAALVVPLTAGAYWPIVAAPEVWHRHEVVFAADPASSLPLRDGEWVVQPWLSALVMWGAWSIGGVAMLAALSAVVGAATMVALLASARRSCAAVVALVAVLLTFPLLQPQLLATQQAGVLCAALLWWLVRGPCWWWAGPAVIAVWANVHGSVVLGAALCAAAGLGMVEEHAPIRRARVRERMAWVAVCSACDCATPLGIGILEYVRSVLSTSDLAGLTPAWRHLDVASWRAAWTFVLVGMVIVHAARAAERLGRLWQLVPLLSMLVLACGAVRNVAFLAVLLTPQVAASLASVWQRRGWPMTLESGLVAATLVVTCVAGVIVLAPGTPMQRALASSGLPPSRLVEDLHRSDEVFVSAEWADYVHLRTGARVSVDARLERYRPQELASYRAAVLLGRDGCGAGDSALVCMAGHRYRIALLRRRSGETLYVQLVRRHRCSGQRAGDAAVLIVLGTNGQCRTKLA